MERFAVLAHQLAHEFLHRTERRTQTTKTIREIEAETVAFVVCSAAGLNPRTRSLSILNPKDVRYVLSRHSRGDWGECCEEDAGANDAALRHCGRIFSVYHDRNQTKFYIITEADRSATTALLPDEY